MGVMGVGARGGGEGGGIRVPPPSPGQNQLPVLSTGKYSAFSHYITLLLLTQSIC